MPIGNDTYATRRHLPHLEKACKTYFVNYSTLHRRILSREERDIVYATCLYEHLRSCFVHCFVIMPDHVHAALIPYAQARLPTILQRMKSVSSHRMKRGVVWQDESFDRIMRSDESLREKCEYICNNRVRARLVERADDYQWLWREWIEGRFMRTGEAPVLH